MMKNKLAYVLLLCGLGTILLISGCVERIDFEIPPPRGLIVIEGLITDNPGPYTIKASRGLNLDALSAEPIPVEGLTITMFDDMGNSENYSQVSPGVYQTGGIIQGQVGNSYHIRLETADGKIYESEPDMLNPTGDISDITFEYEARITEENFVEVPADVFNIYIDGNAGPLQESFTRWKFKGTYKVFTYPELYERRISVYRPFKDPWPCSGYIVVGAPNGGRLEQVADCECCECWVNDFEPSPQLSDNQLVRSGDFRSIKVGEAPINSSTFYDKYLVEVEQMSMSRTAFEFFRLVRSQKENASNIFQSTFGEIIGNIRGVNTSEEIAGIFWASSTKRKTKFIQRSDVPYPIVDIEVSKQPCLTRYDNSTNQKPAEWD